MKKFSNNPATMCARVIGLVTLSPFEISKLWYWEEKGLSMINTAYINLYSKDTNKCYGKFKGKMFV